MYVTNLKDYPIGLDGRVILAPSEVDRWISDDNKGLCQRARVLEANKLVSIKMEVGLDKTGGNATVEVPKEPEATKEPVVEPVKEALEKETKKEDVGETDGPAKEPAKEPAKKPAAKSATKTSK